MTGSISFDMTTCCFDRPTLPATPRVFASQNRFLRDVGLELGGGQGPVASLGWGDVAEMHRKKETGRQRGRERERER